MFIPGAPSFAEPMQGSIAHIILMNYARKMEEFRSRDSEPLNILNLRNEIQLFHDQMKYPWGQLLMLEKNANNNSNLSQYYAIKALANVVNIIEKENFVKLLRKTDQEFETLWDSATKNVNKFLEEISKFELLDNKEITASTLSLFNQIKRERNYVQKSMIKAVGKIKVAWQTIWEKFKLTRKAFEYVLSDLNDAFEITLSREKPVVQDQVLFILAVNKYNEIRIWARGTSNLFKAVPAKRILKWNITEAIYTEMRTDWWLSAVKRAFPDPEINNYANICREDRTDTTVY
jgi:hypothetical protein